MRLQSVSKALAQTERQRERLLDAYLGGVLELAEFERKRKELEARTDSLLAQNANWMPPPGSVPSSPG